MYRDLKVIREEGILMGIYCPDCSAELRDGKSLDPGRWQEKFICSCGSRFIFYHAGTGETESLEQVYN